MKLKLLAFLTIILAVIFIIMAFVFDIPLVYIPENASSVEITLYSIIFFTLEVVISSFLLMHMLKKSNLDDTISDYFNR